MIADKLRDHKEATYADKRGNTVRIKQDAATNKYYLYVGGGKMLLSAKSIETFLEDAKMKMIRAK